METEFESESDLHSRIHSWNDDVATALKKPASSFTPRSPSRQPLRQTSTNPQKRKRATKAVPCNQKAEKLPAYPSPTRRPVTRSCAQQKESTMNRNKSPIKETREAPLPKKNRQLSPTKMNKQLSPTKMNKHATPVTRAQSLRQGHHIIGGEEEVWAEESVDEIGPRYQSQQIPIREPQTSPRKSRGVPVSTSSKSQYPSTEPEDYAVGVKTDTVSSTRSKSHTRQKKNAQLTMEDLALCEPSIKLKNARDVAKEGGMPTAVKSLWKLFNNDSRGYIPKGLEGPYKELADTPNKSKEPPHTWQYQAEGASAVGPELLHRLRLLVDRVIETSIWNARCNAHERQWGASTVNPLLTEITLWPKNSDVRLFNVETCAIKPVQFRMIRPTPSGSMEQVNVDAQSATTDDSITTSRMVDWSLGLKLDEEEMNIIQAAYRTMYDWERSLNQTLNYMKDVPMFADFEIKKMNVAVIPEVQLAFWASGLYKKKIHQGWDTSIPMPGIVVNGHKWELYVFFERRPGALTMMGPHDMGSTMDLYRTYEIIYKMNLLMEWGNTVYKAWFKENILEWCKEKASDSKGKV